ncbi:MAG: hypothetical protein A2076_17785 [Geobacteraceae bacterium GWC2_53_11]|nr:MAG: hypothetical protein A2076_17785 [Geobacteraceae bacterium GWC2_53_11]
MGKLRIILILLMVTVLVAASDFCEAAAPITLDAPLGATVYSVKATDLPDASGVDLTITYDAAALGAPQVKPGGRTSSAMMEMNAGTPGLIRIVFITGTVINGTGELASISFTKKGIVTKQATLSAFAYSATGSQLAVQSIINSQPNPDKDATTDLPAKNNNVSGSDKPGGGAVTGSMGNVYSTTQISSASGSVTPPQEFGTTGAMLRDDSRRETVREESGSSYVAAASPVETKTSSTPAQTPPVSSGATASAATGKAASLKSQSIQSVLDRFRTYKDVRSLKQFSALFDVSSLRAAGIVQSPAIVVSDGKSRVTISIDLGKVTDTPSFSLKGANQKSLRRVSDKKWELEALPQKGKSDIRLSILLKGEHIEIPLVVIPPLGQAYAREFDAFTATTLDAQLAKPLKNNKPAYDLNSDKRQDYIDDFILVGHWLLKQQHGVKGVVTKPAAIRK